MQLTYSGTEVFIYPIRYLNYVDMELWVPREPSYGTELGEGMSIKYFKQKQEGFEHITLEEFNLLERIRKQKIKDEEEDEKQRREEEMGGI